MSGIYASLQQAQINILEILNVWMPVPLYLSGMVNLAYGGIAFPPLKVRDLRLDLAKNFSFSDSLLGKT